MRILFVCENYLPHYGGAEVVFKNLAEGFVKRGHIVSLVTQKLKGTKKFEIINGVRVYRINSLNCRYLFSFFSILKVFKLAKKVDLIQTTTFNGAFPAWLVSKLKKKPAVLTVHEVWINKWHKVTDLSLINCFIHNLLEKMIYFLKFDKYVCVSKATKKDLLNIGISQNLVTTIYNGLDYDFWSSENFNDKLIRKNLDLKKEFIYFSWGRPGSSKGFEYVITAVPDIAKKIDNSVFLFMLSNSEVYKKRYNQLMNLIKKVKLSNSNLNIIVVPSVSYEELGNYIKSVDCVVVPSIAEGFGYNVVEACAMGKPVVATNVGSLPEVVSNKFLLVDSKDSMQIAKGVINISKKRYNQNNLKKFMWKDSINSYLSLYDILK